MCDFLNLARSKNDLDFVYAAHPSLRSQVETPQNSQRQLVSDQSQVRETLKRKLVLDESSDENEMTDENDLTCERSTQAGT